MMPDFVENGFHDDVFEPFGKSRRQLVESFGDPLVKLVGGQSRHVAGPNYSAGSARFFSERIEA